MITAQDALTTAVPGRPPAGQVRASTVHESGADAEARTIGEAGKPVRALTFSSGGIETAMQLGVVHALLVSRAEPPEVVLGVSAGAVNAVALAEILQAESAGDSAGPGAAGDPLEPKVAKFRRIFEDFQNCPHDLLDAMLPDAYQIDAQKPFKPLRLPVHAKVEREGRDDGLRSRAGLINFYNELLLLKAPIGTITRAVRRLLGIVAAHEAAPKWSRAIQGLEFFKLWMLMGGTLHRLARVAWPLGRTVVSGRPWNASLRKEHGVSAARLIFRSRLWARAGSLVRDGLSLLVLASSWAFVSILMLGVAALIGHLPLRLLKGFPESIAGVDEAFSAVGRALIRWPVPSVPAASVDLDPLSKLDQLSGYAPALGAIVLSAFGFALIFAVVAAVLTKEPLRVTLGLAMGTMASFVLLLAVWVAVVVAFSGAIAYLVNQLGGLAAGALPWIRLPAPQLGAIWIMGSAVAIALLVVVVAVVRRARFLVNLLARYGLADSLLHPHPLRQFYVRLFDPGYYGAVPMDSVVERALQRDEEPTDEPKKKDGKKRLEDYATRHSPAVHVALTVADVSTGELSVIDGGVPVVDGLMAATAASPFFPPVPIEKKLYIDAANVATQTTEALMNFLRTRVRPDATAVHVYSVASLPLSKAELDPEKKPADPPDPSGVSIERTDLVEVTGRAFQIQRFRDAHLNQKLVNLLSRVLPPGNVLAHCDGDDYVRAWVYPIEPDTPLDTVRRFAKALDNRARRRVVAETVADGCRAALQTMLSHRIRDVARAPGTPVIPIRDGGQAVTCAAVIMAHNADMQERPSFPGSAPNPSVIEPRTPGLVEVCRHCVLYRGDPDNHPRHLVVSARKAAPPDWYVQDRITKDHAAQKASGNGGNPQEETPAPAPNTAAVQLPEDEGEQVKKDLESWHAIQQTRGTVWPRPRDGVEGSKRPTVSFLFSGGVFRGVYQMGVLNALNLVGLRPDLIAGASVGSITAAMIARVFREPLPGERVSRIARLAATYLALDRLILTDRFADFIRGFTVRAAATRFSLSQADRVFRTFDKPLPGDFDRELRAVAAGLERLFYISPFELKDLVEAARRRNGSRVFQLLALNLQEWLGRMGVGNQVLGAEPLALLIAEHVLEGLPGYSIEQPGSVPFDAFSSDGIYFLATATNLTRGRLEVLGERPDLDRPERRAMLLDGLLASSAFPGVFRPRWSWEVMPSAETADQYIDGGVTDNLPLDAVAQFLYRASRAHLVDARPNQGGIPHLLLCASLEPRLTTLTPEEQQLLCFNWPALYRRAAQLGYNKKIDLYAEIQRSIREVMRTGEKNNKDAARGWTPLDLEVVAIKPDWLCNTFAFHPMLGFQRKRQAKSIAHGCASTLLELARPRPGDNAGTWKAAWGIDRSQVPDAEVASRSDPYVPLPVGEDRCWFNGRAICPFSRTGLANADTGLLNTTLNEVTTIYTLCGRHDTHRPSA